MQFTRGLAQFPFAWFGRQIKGLVQTDHGDAVGFIPDTRASQNHVYIILGSVKCVIALSHKICVHTLIKKQFIAKKKMLTII